MRESEVSNRGRILRELLSEFTSNNLIGAKYRNGELRKKIIEPNWKCPVGFSLEIIQLDNFSMEFLYKTDQKSEKVILQLHGGGYVGGMRNAYRSFAKFYHKASHGANVLTIDYRVAPESPFPGAFEDAIEAYNWLIYKGFLPHNIILAGDSAGGGLAMALCHYLRDNQRELPAAIIAMSPWTDLSASGESYLTNYEIDPLFGNTKDSLIYNKDYVGESDVTNPYISPLYGAFDQFPPMLIQVGTHEMLLSDSTEVAQKATQAGVKVKITIYEGMFHVFQMARSLLPESRRAWAEIARFINIIFK